LLDLICENMNYFNDDHLVLVVIASLIYKVLILYLIINAATKVITRENMNGLNLIIGKNSQNAGALESVIKQTFDAMCRIYWGIEKRYKMYISRYRSKLLEGVFVSQ